MCGTARVVRDCSVSEEEEEEEEQEEEEEASATVPPKDLSSGWVRPGTAQPTSYNPTPPRIGDQQILGDH